MMTKTACHFGSFMLWAFLWLRKRRGEQNILGGLGSWTRGGLGWWPRSGEDGSSVVPPVFGMGLEWLRAAGAGQAQDRLSPCVGSLSIFIIVIPWARPVIICREAPHPLLFSLFLCWDPHAAFAARYNPAGVGTLVFMAFRRGYSWWALGGGLKARLKLHAYKTKTSCLQTFCLLLCGLWLFMPLFLRSLFYLSPLYF